MTSARSLCRRALEALGIRRLVLAVHDASLPGDPRDDLGRGAPLSLGGRDFLAFAAELGFDGVQLGPQGETSAINASPYDGTIFSRSTLSIALGPLVAEGLISEAALEEAVSARPAGAAERTAHRHVHQLVRRVLALAFAQFEQARPAPLGQRLRAFAAANADWLGRDGLYAALAAEHGDQDWLRWPEADRTYPPPRCDALRRRHQRLLNQFQFEQFLAHEQHTAFHAEARELGLRLYGDLQIGLGHQDVWSWGSLLLPDFRIGAPPSRTNPEGQPWSYAVLNPNLYGSDAAPGPASFFVRRRVGKLLAEFDGLRIDHPHGLIDPWVYRAAQPEPLRAVQEGARLFSSPEVPALANLAIAELHQLDLASPRYGDGRVRELSEAQVARYAILFNAVVAAAQEHGRDSTDLIAEVLSTMPYPVGRVLARHGLGRFRVLQKVGLADPLDVYRSENAAPADWIMAGNHDTEPIWRVAERWLSSGTARAHAEYLASRLIPDSTQRAAWSREVAADASRLAGAKLAELFAGPARNVMVFFPDLLGMREVYNRPGTVSEENWSLRVPPDFRARYAAGIRAGRALDLPRALAMAIRARGSGFAKEQAPTLAELERAGVRSS